MLFEEYKEPINNILPFDGEVAYVPFFFNQKDADSYFIQLQNEINWENDHVRLFGKEIITKRMVAWYADDHFEYGYSNTSKIAQTWPEFLKEIKSRIEQLTGEQFNSCLLNLYHNGSEIMGWHSDNEKALKKGGTIVSVSFGVGRRFEFKHRHVKQHVKLMLNHGDVLIMKGETQENWLHQLPKMTKIHANRINLTFRQFEIAQ